MGGSHGGSSTLAAMVDTPENAKRTNTGIAAAIALIQPVVAAMAPWRFSRARSPEGLSQATQAPSSPLRRY
jgi:hypothetical protein